ncbi:MAG TPA: phosphoribosylanthranilate isomerase [Sphingobacteriaceae bacterium]
MNGALKIKVCGMRDPANIAAVSALKPDYLGFIFFPGSRRFVGPDPETLFSQITADPGIVRTGVFVDESPEVILDHARRFQLGAVQLHGGESPAVCSQLLAAGLEVIKAFGVGETFDFGRLDPYRDACTYFLFDTKTSGHGGSGRAFDWSLLDGYTGDRPFFLSGGVGPENIGALQNISSRYFYGTDLNSRFETEPGLKDTDRLRLAFTTLKSSSNI